MIEETRYGLRVHVDADYDTAIDEITEALKEEGFGVLTRIDVRETLKQKLDRDFRRYVILGACNPVLADQALRAELEVGLLLPCNVIVYEESPNTAIVAAMAPLAVISMAGNEQLAGLAADADARLRRALAAVEPK